MNDQENKVDTQVGDTTKARVETHESILAQLTANADPAQQDDLKHESKDGDKSQKKQTAQERISELAKERREAVAKANERDVENQELKREIERLKSGPAPIERQDRPQRNKFSSQDEFEDALGEYHAKKILAEREEQSRQAKLAAEMKQIDDTYEKSISRAQSKYDDFAEVVSAASVSVPDFIVMAIKENENGGDITYYLSKHLDEAKEIFAMRPVKAMEQILALGREFGKSDQPTIEKKVAEKKKAPEPINPVSGSADVNSSGSKDFASYKARRMAEKRK